MTLPDPEQRDGRPRFRHAARPRARARDVVAAVALVALVALLGVTLVAPNPTLAGALGLVVLVVCLVALYQVTFSGRFAPVAVTFWSFVAVWVGFAPLVQIRDDIMAWPDLPLHQFYVTAQVILLTAVATFWIGYGRGAPVRAGPPVRRFRVTIEQALVATVVATLLTAACLPQTGGLAVRFTDRDTLQAAIKQAGLSGGKDQALVGLLSTLPAAVCLVSLVLCLLCLRERNHATPKARLILLGLTGISAVLNVIYNNPLTANRFATFSVMLAATFAFVRFERQSWRTLFSAGMLGGLAVVYPLANLFRNDKSRSNLRLGLDAYYTYDFDGFQQTVNSVYYVHVHGNTWGHHLISALLFWVPRSIWDGKAIAAGNVVAASRGYTFQNLSLPFWAEVAVEFSLAGVVVVFFFYGRIAARLDRALGDSRISLPMALAVLFAACQIGLLRGPLGAQIPLVGAAFVTLVVTVIGWRFRPWGLTRDPDTAAGAGGGPHLGSGISAKAGA